MPKLRVGKIEIAQHRFNWGQTEKGLAYLGTAVNEANLGKYFKNYELVNHDGPVPNLLQQLEDYFKGKRQTFDGSLDLIGTPFQKQVWQQLLQIPYGQTTTYGELAQAIGRPKAVRAVGGAVGRNPVMIVVPCHRVIGKDGSLTGFGGGLPLKKELLSLEQENA